MGATMHDVARVAGVSIKTVSNVVNDYPYVRDDTRRRVQEAIAALSYRPNVSARGLRSGRTGVIALAVPALRENYFAELADHIIRLADARGVGVVVEQTGGHREAEILAISGGRRRFTDGLLLSPVNLGQLDVDVLDVDYPLVLLGDRIFNGPTDHVAIHNTAAARAGVEHLLSLGRRRIAILGGSDDDPAQPSSASLRLAGYREALAAAGVPEDPALIRPLLHWTRDAGSEAVHALVAEGVAFDGLFALNDTLALGALRGLARERVTVPDDVAVLGFDNIDEARFSVPSLSSVDAGKEQIAETALDLLLERISEKGPRKDPRTVQPAFSVVARESTGFGGGDV
ncbi:LacI family DNA-binding transcriptional regulator [Microbacterium sp. NPDC079995]|uniref:LacI family DNA-binding transcriptional regulator n=1 Tax=unclassified Microbacterium TaxID=2609290 RepID=UPI00345043E3